MALIHLNNGVISRIQSPYIYLDAAGSDGSSPTGSTSKITRGIHLRWALLGDLGKHHLPKGEYTQDPAYKGGNSLNRDEDFIRIYRTPFVPLPVAVDFMNDSPLPGDFSDDHDDPVWYYRKQVGNADCTVSVRFLMTKDDYDTRVDTYTTGGSFDDKAFIREFQGEIEIEVNNGLSFGFQANVRALTVDVDNGVVPVADLKHFSSLGGATIPTESNAYGLFNPVQQGIYTHFSGKESWQENIRVTRLNWGQGELESIVLHPIDLFLKQTSTWEQVDDHSSGQKGFSLTANKSLALSRLKGKTGADFELGDWPRYDERYLTDSARYENKFWNGVAPYNFADYHTTETDYLPHAIHQYLVNSKDGFESASGLSDENEANAKFGVRYIDLLNLVSIDYHLARMLGFGHIDKFTETNWHLSSVGDSDKFVYLMEYVSRFGDTSSGQEVQHLYLCPPIAIENERQPGGFELTVEKGIVEASGDINPDLTDAEGYGYRERARYVSLMKAPTAPIELVDIDPSYVPTVGLDRWQQSKSVVYYLEKGPNQTGAALSVLPELWNGEVIPAMARLFAKPNEPLNSRQRLHIHKIDSNTGDDEVYQAWGINWFARPAQTHMLTDLNETIFTRVNGLMPPSNLHAHYIQPESPRIFTTSAEQAGNLEDVRVTFEWNHQHHHAASEADDPISVRFAYRKDLPEVVQGVISSITELGAEPDLLTLNTGSYTNKSITPQETVTPSIDASIASRFVGGVITVDGDQYQVEEITATGTNPKIKIRKLIDKIAHQPEADAEYRILSEYRVPEAGSRFTLIENLNNANDWDQELVKTVAIQDFGSTHEEVVQDLEGVDLTYHYKGLIDTATITPIGSDGLYEVVFDSISLPAHPDSDVSWYKGTARIPLNATPAVRKDLEVFRIDTSGSNLRLEVFDGDPVGGAIQTSGSVSVNFHPGYHLHLAMESAPSEFVKTNIEPVLGEEVRKSLFTAWSAVGPSSSNIAMPVPLFAVEQYTPQAPVMGNYPVYATRPDVDGKSSFSFDMEVQDDSSRRPYGFIFYRANERSLLDELYTESTVQDIYNDLKAIGEDVPLNVRWAGLLGGETTGSAGHFLDYGTGYALPVPNHPDIDLTVADAVVDALVSAFTPLTKEPVLYSKLADDRMNTLKTSDSEPFPMVIKYTESGTNKKMVRFTDYSLDGASTNFYFYFAVEMGPDFETSEPSGAAGPINLVNALPPEAPKVKKVTTRTEDVLNSIPPAVLFETEPYLESEGVEKVRIYRTTEEVYANSVRLMEEVGDLDVAGPLVDEFTDLDFPPFGEPVFYKLVGLRAITNEHGNAEYVPSVASRTQLASVVDVVNPPAPEVTVSFDPNSPPTHLDQVVLTWNKTAHNATYMVQKMNESGNWEEIYRVKDNASTLQFPPAITDPGPNFGQPDFTTYPAMSALVKDQNGKPVYHRFQVVVENASGLLSLEEKMVAV